MGKLKLSLVVVADVALSAANLLEIVRGRGKVEKGRGSHCTVAN